MHTSGKCQPATFPGRRSCISAKMAVCVIAAGVISPKHMSGGGLRLTASTNTGQGSAVIRKPSAGVPMQGIWYDFYCARVAREPKVCLHVAFASTYACFFGGCYDCNKSKTHGREILWADNMNNRWPWRALIFPAEGHLV